MDRMWVVLFGFIAAALAGCGAKPSGPVTNAPATVGTDGTKPTPAAPVVSATVAETKNPELAQQVAQQPTGDPRLRDLAARSLESDGQGGFRKNEKVATELEKLSPEEVAQMWPLLKDPQPEVRRGVAVFLLPQFNPTTGEQVTAFSELLDDGDRMVRARALDAVRQCALAQQMSILPRLTALLTPQREDRAENRTAVARLCGALKQEGADALPALESAATKDPDPKVRSAALVAIAQIAAPSGAIEAMKNGLADKDAAVRLVAAARLRQMGPAAAPAAGELARLLTDSSADVADAAAEALIRIGADAVQPLAEQLASKNAAARKLAVICLARIGSAAKPAVPHLAKLKQDPDPQVKQLAEAALKQLTGP